MKTRRDDFDKDQNNNDHDNTSKKPRFYYSGDFYPHLFHSGDEFKIDLTHKVKITPTILTDCIIPYLQDHSEITTVNLYGTDMGSECVKIFANFLTFNHTITNLTIVNNNIGDEGAKAFASALKANKTIKKINLSNNNMGDESAIALAEAIQINNALTYFNISTNHITEQGACALAKALQSNRSIQSFIIDENPIQEKGAFVLFDAKRSISHLQSIIVDDQYNKLSDDGITEFLENNLEGNNKLSFSDGEMNSRILKYFVIPYFKYLNPSINELNFICCKINEEFIQELTKMLSSTTSIKTLYISDLITPYGCKAIADLKTVANEKGVRLTLPRCYAEIKKPKDLFKKNKSSALDTLDFRCGDIIRTLENKYVVIFDKRNELNIRLTDSDVIDIIIPYLELNKSNCILELNKLKTHLELNKLEHSYEIQQIETILKLEEKTKMLDLNRLNNILELNNVQKALGLDKAREIIDVDKLNEIYKKIVLKNVYKKILLTSNSLLSDAAIVKLIEADTTITVYNIEKLEVGPPVLKALAKRNNLTELYIGNNDINDNDLCEIVTNNPNLEILDVGNTGAVCQNSFPKTCKAISKSSIQEVYFDWHFITDSQADDIFQAPCIKKISLACNPSLSDKCFKSILERKDENQNSYPLQEINLRNYHSTDSLFSDIVLAEVISKNQQLTYLNLTERAIGDKTAAAIASHLTLKEAYLKECKLTAYQGRLIAANLGITIHICESFELNNQVDQEGLSNYKVFV